MKFKEYLDEKNMANYFRIDYKSDADKKKIIGILNGLKVKFEEEKGFIHPLTDISSMNGQDIVCELDSAGISY